MTRKIFLFAVAFMSLTMLFHSLIKLPISQAPGTSMKVPVNLDSLGLRARTVKL